MAPCVFCNAYFILVSFTLCHLRHRDINILNFIPCAAADDAVRCQSEDTLEGTDGILSRFAEDAVRDDLWDQRIVVGNAVELFLNFHDLTAAAADGERVAGIRGGDAGDLFCSVDIDAASVKGAQNFDCRVALLS